MKQYKSLQELTGCDSGLVYFDSGEYIITNWEEVNGVPYIVDDVLHGDDQPFEAKTTENVPCMIPPTICTHEENLGRNRPENFFAWEVFAFGGYICTVVIYSHRKIRKMELYHKAGGLVITGPNPNMTGNTSGLWGDCTGLTGSADNLLGDCSNLTGDCSGIWGICSDLRGDCTGVYGDCTCIWGNLDECGLSSAVHRHSVDIRTLLAA